MMKAYLLVLFVSAVAVAKNSLPRDVAVESLPRHVVARGHRDTTLSPDHVFQSNYRTNFSWEDNRLQDRLWRGKEKQRRQDSLSIAKLAKRAPTTTILGTVIKLPSCAGCIRQAATGEQANLNTLTPDYLKRVMLMDQGQLLGRCVFYTSVEDKSDALQRWLLGGADTHPSLSKIATDWANPQNLVTIWNLYSGANDVTNTEDNPQDYNYWEVYTEGSWLNNLKDDQVSRPYCGQATSSAVLTGIRALNSNISGPCLTPVRTMLSCFFFSSPFLFLVPFLSYLFFTFLLFLGMYLPAQARIVCDSGPTMRRHGICHVVHSKEPGKVRSHLGQRRVARTQEQLPVREPS